MIIEVVALKRGDSTDVKYIRRFHVSKLFLVAQALTLDFYRNFMDNNSDSVNFSFLAVISSTLVV